MTTANRKLKRHTLYAPTRGINSRASFFDVPEGYALKILNGFTRGQSIISRPKWGNEKSVTAVTGSNFGKIQPYVYRNAVLVGNLTNYYAVNFTPFSDDFFQWQVAFPISPLTKTGTPGLSSNFKDGVSYLKHRFFAAYNALGNLNEVTHGTVRLQDAAYTGTGFSISDVRFVQSFKQRLYMIVDELTYYYSPLSALTGTVTGVDLSDYFDESTRLIYCGSYSQLASTTIDEQMVFIGDQGEILIFSGDFPAASNWQLVAKLQVGPLMGRGQNGCRIIKAGGDLYFLTVYGLISLRLAVESGKNGALQTVSDNLDPLFRSAFLDRSTSDSEDLYDLSYLPSIEAIVMICRENNFSTDSSLTQFLAYNVMAYHIPTQSWYIWTDIPIVDFREISGFIIGTNIKDEKLAQASYVYNTDIVAHASANNGNQPLQIFYPYHHFGNPSSNKIVKKLIVYFATIRSSSSSLERELKYAIDVDGNNDYEFKTRLYKSSASSTVAQYHQLVIEPTQPKLGNHISLALSWETQINIEYFKTEVYYEEGGLH